MILGLGSDIVDVQRISTLLQRFPERFLRRVFTEQEQNTAQKSISPAASYAKRFAAKEAFLKAIGTGLDNDLSWQHIEILNHDNGRPYVNLKGRARERVEALTPKGFQARVDITLADTSTLAHAVVILSAISQSSLEQ